MKKVGIDLGSASLGWVITEDGIIVKKGVTRFDTGMMKGQSGGYVSPTRDRREVRSKRNLIRARKYRKTELLKVLVENSCVPLSNIELEVWSKYKKGRVQKFPENESFLKWLACDFTYEGGIKYKNPYELRVKALYEKLTSHEFGRALYHLVQRRGYKDIGETDSETEKQISRRSESGFQKALDENDKIISKALLNEFLNKNKRARNQYPYREEYRYELEELCKVQGYNISKSAGKGENYNDKFVGNLWKAIIWQRDLKSQKGTIGKCTFEPKKLRCPVSHPIFEIFRAWSFINTIMYFDENDEKQSISKENKNKLFEFFLKKDKNFKFEEIRGFLDKQLQTNKKYNYPIDKDGKYDTSVSGMPISKGLIDIWGDEARKALDIIELQNISQKAKSGGFGNAPKIANNYSIIDLWHILFAFDKKAAKEKDFLKTFAKEKLNMVDEKQIDKFVKLKDKFSQGYADLSVNATCRIIPFLKEGYLYNESVVLAKIPEILGKNWEANRNKILITAKEANKLYEWNKIIIGITNNLIDRHKGLKKDNEIFAFNDYEYTLDDRDIKSISMACQGYFGEKSWSKKNNKNEIIEAVKQKYQEYFKDQKRSYRELITLTDVFNKKLKEQNINLDANQLYHHSNTENIYLKKCKTDSETEKPILPKAKNKFGFVVDILPGVQIDSIKNPMFNKSMSILRRLMNEFIKEDVIDKETEIVIEVARELNDNNKRIAIERYQNERKNNRDKYREFLSEFKKIENPGLNVEESIPTFELWTEQIFEKTNDENGKPINNINRIEVLKEKDAIKRYELWTEQKGQCMYTGKMISLSKLFSNEIDIEHTIPRSILPDNTMANQTVCFAWYNRDKKKNQMPFYCDNFDRDIDGWGTRIEPRLNNWREIRDNWKSRYNKSARSQGNEDEIAKNKRIQEKHYCRMHLDYWNDKIERFEIKEIKDSWVRRQLVDTQMVSKYAREFLKTYFMKVAVQKGTVTAAFRKLYGFQEEDEIKSRNKHTHHAIDALVLTLIPTNSSYRERIIKEYFKAIEDNNKEKIKEIQKTEIPQYFNVQKFINEIENSTLIYNFEKDTVVKQTSKIIRKRGKRQYLKDKNGNFSLDKNGNKILLIAQGDTVRSELYAQTYLGKIKDVERDEFEKEIKVEKLNLSLKVKGFAVKDGVNWKFKTGKDEYCFVKREDINKVKASDSSILSIVDPVIRELVSKQKNNTEIKDYQGNIIRHVRIRTKTGKEIKDRVNYLSEYNYKNKFYAETGSIPYAILLQQFDNNVVKREMIPIASFEISKMYKQAGKFDVEKYIQDFQPQYMHWNKELLKVGLKVFVLKEDSEYNKKNDLDFQKNRLYIITQFSDVDNTIMLKYHLEAQDDDAIDSFVKSEKDILLRDYELKYEIPEIVEDTTIENLVQRKKKYLKERYSFKSFNDYRFKKLINIIGIDEVRKIKNKLGELKKYSSSIEIDGKTPLLKVTKENWNFLIEGKDFEMKPDGTIIFK